MQSNESHLPLEIDFQIGLLIPFIIIHILNDVISKQDKIFLG